MNRADFIRVLLLAPLGGQQLFAASGSFTGSVAFLLGQQSPDGAWRSDAYGAFRDGRALTPIVLRCLARLPDPSLEEAREKAASWLAGQGGDLFSTFPVHLAAAVLETIPFVESLEPLRRAAMDRLLELQCPNGGWSYSPIAPAPDVPLPAMQQPNLSATAIALDGLHAAGARSTRDPKPFLRTCQNHATADPDFDDGGFFQMPIDPSRNKAGQAGTDRKGKKRFKSYAAATADGLRCLLCLGEGPDSPQVVAARSWLDRSEWTPASTPIDLTYYSARSMALTAQLPGGRTSPCRRIARSMVELRQDNGSWTNPAGEMRENCPLVATSLALEALTLSAI